MSAAASRRMFAAKAPVARTTASSGRSKGVTLVMDTGTAVNLVIYGVVSMGASFYAGLKAHQNEKNSTAMKADWEKKKAEMKTDWEQVMARETEVLKAQADSVKAHVDSANAQVDLVWAHVVDSAEKAMTAKVDSIPSPGCMAVVIPSVLAATALGVSLFK